MHGLGVDGDRDGTAVVPLGMHAVFEEGLRHTNGSVAALVKAPGGVMHFLVRIFENTKPTSGSSSKIVIRGVEFSLETVKNAAFKKDPAVLDALEIPSETVPEAALGASGHDPLAAQSFQLTSDATVEPASAGSRSSAPATKPAGNVAIFNRSVHFVERGLNVPQRPRLAS